MAEKAHASLFVVLGRSRTGSNMLVRLLNQHPELRCEGELFRRPARDEWRHQLDELRRSRTRWAGFKIFYYHAKGDGDELWRWLTDAEEIPVVHLRRRNILRTVVSRKIADTSNRWISVGAIEAMGPKRVVLSATELEREFERTRRFELEFAARFAAHPMLDVEYEDLAADPFGVCGQVTDMLAVPSLPGEAEVRTRRQNPEPLQDLLGNYDELAARFTGTRWAEFFSE